MESIKLVVQRPDAWPKYKRLSRVSDGKTQVFMPKHNEDGVATFDLPADYANHLLSVSPGLFAVADEGGGKSKEQPAPSLENEKLDQIPYRQLQTLYSKHTGKPPAGKKKADLVKELGDLKLGREALGGDEEENE